MHTFQKPVRTLVYAFTQLHKPHYPSETQMCFTAFSESLKQRKKSVYMMSPNELSASKQNYCQ